MRDASARVIFGQTGIRPDIVIRMRCVVQRVSSASVAVADRVIGRIGQGFLVLVGFTAQDGAAEIEWMAHKVNGLRIFDDENGVMNRSIHEVSGEVLAVSQFTLYADLRKGNRPSYNRAAPADVADALYVQFVNALERDLGRSVETGEFGAEMQVSLINDGPVTLIVDTAVRRGEP